MKVSIVMATYNGEKYIEEQLESIVHQTRQPDEVLIYDDGSTDNTENIVYDIIEKYQLTEKWHFKKNEENKGVVRNFVSGALQATGDIIFYSDQDDIWDKNKIAKMERGFEEHTDMLACYCLRQLVDSNGKNLPMRYEFMTNVKIRSKEFQKISINEAVKYNKSPGLCLAIKRNLIQETSEMILQNGLTHDLPIGTVASIYDGYYVLNQRLVYYRQHSNNVSEPGYTLAKRLKKIERQIAGRQGRYVQMVAISKTYGKELGAMDLRNLKKAIDATEESIENLKSKNILKLFRAIFDRNPMMNRWIALNNVVICLRSCRK